MSKMNNTSSSKKRRDNGDKHRNNSIIQKAVTSSPDSSNSITTTTTTATAAAAAAARRRSSVRISTSTSSRVHKVTNLALLILSVSVSLTLFMALLQIFDLDIPDHTTTTSTHPQFLPSSHHLSLPISETTAQTTTIEDSVPSPDRSHHQQQQPNPNQPSEVHATTSLWAGRKNLYRLLSDAKVAENITQTEIDQMPLDRHIQELYGDHPIFITTGLTNQNHCQTFRETIPLAKRRLAVAGLFNSGTNLLETMLRNVQMIRPSLWQVPWGKHRLARVRDNHTAPEFQYYNKTEILPVVIVRDPYMWFQSMCVHPYSVRWRHGNYHCPNFVPNEQDRIHYPHIPDDHVNVNVRYEKYDIANFTSLADLWVEWHREYVQAEFPVLMIRFEDLVFKPKLVLKQIAECAGGKVKTPIRYQINTAKSHGSGTNFVKAIVKTANKMARSHNMTQQDLEYAERHLDRGMMELFHYRHPSEIVQSKL